jgi:hypothetical protein
MWAEDIKCGMHGIPPTADKAQTLIFLWDRESNKRRWDRRRTKDARQGQKKKIKNLDQETWKEGTGRSEDLDLDAREILKSIVKI